MNNNTTGSNIFNNSFGKADNSYQLPDYSAGLQNTLGKPSSYFQNNSTQYAQNNSTGTASDAQTHNYNKYRIGSLSQEFESNGNPAAIGYDGSGGYSYGLYQIATKPGTMQEYIQYLENSPNTAYNRYANVLSGAGGNTGATKRTDAFENAWVKLASDPEFASSQSEFISQKRYDKIINKIQDIKGLNLQDRHPVISDVIRSMAVQHGQAQIPIHNAIGTNSDISLWSDRDIINALYDARSNYMAGIHYKNADDIRKQQNIINKRYPQERKKALDSLTRYQK